MQTVTVPTDYKEKINIVSKGVAYERVDHSTRYLVQALLPKGDMYLGRLMNNAVIQPYTHPDPSQELQGDAAVISVTKGYVELSHILGMSYDTTHMYTLVSHALGLLNIEKRDKQMTIIIPLGAYRPPAELREILRELKLRYSDRRPKVRRLINTITERIAAIIPIEPETSDQSFQDELLKRVQRGISAQGLADPDGQIAMSVLTEIAPLIATCAEPSTAQGEQRITEYLPKFYRSSKPLRQRESPQRENQDQEIAATLNLPDGLSNNEQGKRSSAKATTTSRSMIATTAQERFFGSKHPCSQKVGGEKREDSFACGRFSESNLPANQQSEAPLWNVPASVDANLPVKVDSGEISPLKNGIGNGKNSTRKFMNDRSVPDPDLGMLRSEVKKHAPYVSLPIAHPKIRHQALALATLIEGNEENIGAYVQMLRRYDLQVIKAGVIATLQRKHCPEGRQALRKPGAYFTQQVKRYQAVLPEQMAEYLETYAQASYEEIDTALEKQAQAQTVHQQSGLCGLFRATSHVKQGQPMDEGMATKLKGRIAAEDSDVQVKGICKMQDGTYAVKVYIDPIEHDYCSIEEWETYHAQMLALEQEVSR